MVVTIKFAAESKEEITFYLSSVAKEARLFIKQYQYEVGAEESISGGFTDLNYKISINAFANEIGGENA